MDNEINTKIIFDFDDQNQIDNWISINDNVMGGNSVGKILISDSCLLFTGNLSLENNGGFSSIRTKPRNYDLIDFHGLKIQVKGDGRTYQFRIRTNDKFDGIAYSFEFNTIEDTWIEVELPFESFLPTFRGRVLNDVPLINPDDIRQIGFLIADKDESEFRLYVDKIFGYK